ncbi:MAG TPA: ATP-binding protein [Thermoanaerobaculia bacterium]|jgi:signal transduction histidine kinase
MHPLRVLLIVSLGIAAAVAWAFGALLVRVGLSSGPVIVLAGVVFVAFMVPWGGVGWWALRRARDLDELIDRTRRVAAGAYERAIGDRTYHGELDELGRAAEEMRGLIVRQRALYTEHRAAMAQIVASLGEGVMAVNGQGHVVVANERFAEMFESHGSVVGQTVVEAVRKQSIVAAVDRALHGMPSSERVTIGDRIVDVRVVPVSGSAEIAAVTLFIDITPIERLQRIRKEFLDDFSHEVRTPLAGLRSATETLDQGGLTTDHEQQLRNVMLRQLTRIERLVQDLAELNRIESGELVLQPRPLHLREVLTELCEDFGELSFVIDGGDPVANADPTRIQQVFTNLLDNALKHGGKGNVHVELAGEGAEAIVRISDEGEGIPAAELERIFHRFYRVDKSRSQKVPGVGLGLAITKHLVLLHGGSIRAYNRQGGGATFEVRLPAAVI